MYGILCQKDVLYNNLILKSKSFTKIWDDFNLIATNINYKNKLIAIFVLIQYYLPSSKFFNIL